MRLKEIKPGMVIHCKTQEEKKALLEEAERLGYVWAYSKNKPTSYLCEGNTIHFHEKNERNKFNYIAWSDDTKGVTEFSDLILPELTAEEAIEWLAQHRLDDEYENAFGFASPFDEIINEECTAEDIVKGIAKWKSNHEKKEPEIETVDICRIIEIQPDRRKRCVHEIDLNPDGEMLFKEQIEEILKRYCMEHDGEFIAVHGVVSRVKAVE